MSIRAFVFTNTIAWIELFCVLYTSCISYPDLVSIDLETLTLSNEWILMWCRGDNSNTSSSVAKISFSYVGLGRSYRLSSRNQALSIGH